ncbi:MAG: nitrilase-related carbon-nitrogen hydrolase, partial [Anaeroplasmataceae bacterium]
MLNNKFLKVSCITPVLEVGNPKINIDIITKLVNKNKASIVCLPELCITGYSCQDFFLQSSLINESYKAIQYFISNNTHKGIVVLGSLFELNGSLFNCAFVFFQSKLIGIVPKRSLPNTKEYYEKRWFASASSTNITEVYFLGNKIPFGNILFKDHINNINFGVEICEDMWSTITPGNLLSLNGANIILNISASNEVLGKAEIRKTSVLENSRKNCGAYIYASAGIHESTSDTVFSGHNIIAVNGKLVKETENFDYDSEVIYADIDISMINFLRRNNSTLRDLLDINYSYQTVELEFVNSTSFKFENDFDKFPFIPFN